MTIPPMSLLCRVQQDREHNPCSGTTDDGTDSPCGCRCHALDEHGELADRRGPCGRCGHTRAAHLDEPPTGWVETSCQVMCCTCTGWAP